MFLLIFIISVFPIIINCQTTEWRPPRLAKIYRPGMPTTIMTPGDRATPYARYTVEDRRQFIFQVKACHGALLSFAAFMDDDVERDLVEIVLGNEENRRSQIRIFRTGATSLPVFDTATPFILHCNELRTFWIQWDYDFFQVGRGPIVNEQTFMNWRDSNQPFYNSISLWSSNGTSCVWVVNENSGDLLIIDTPDEHKYENMWKEVTDKTFWTFGVRAGGDVHVILSEKLGVTNVNIYEFVVGGWFNNRSVIRTQVIGGGDSIKDQLDLKNIVSESERREFWISWANGLIELGQGGVYGVQRLLKWKDEQPRMIRYLSVTTGFGNIGRWYLQDDQESVTHIFTDPVTSTLPEDRFQNAWISTPREEFFTFGVKACNDASVLLSDYIAVNTDLSIEVVLGTESNSIVAFRRLNNPNYLASAYTTFLLSCDQVRNFWISWHNGTVRVGAGFIYSHNVMLEMQVFDMVEGGFRVGALGLGTSLSKGEWRIRESVGERIHIISPAAFNHFGYVWRTVYQQPFIVFRVKSCSDCHVSLSSTIGVDYDESYLDLVIGGWTNTQTQIRRVRGPNGDREDFSAPFATPNLLICDTHIDLWVSWYGGRIMMGHGALPGSYVLLDHPLATPFYVKAVSFSGWNPYAADFIIDEDTGDYVTAYTGSIEGVRWMELQSYITYFPFKVRSCNEMNIYICSQTNKVDCFRVVLGTQDNTKSELYDNGVLIASADTPGLYDCGNNRHFWFRWNSVGKLDVGLGTIPGFNTILSYGGRVRSILAVGFEDSFGRWQIFHNTMLSFSFYTPTSFSYEQVWEGLNHRRSLSFGVAACSDVHLMLSSDIRNVTNMYEVVIGGWFNSRSVIRRDDFEYAVVDTTEILGCSVRRYFWVTWQFGAIEVGRGEIAGIDKFIDYQPLALYDIRAIGYSTGYDFDGNWYLKGAGVQPTPPPVTANPGGTIESPVVSSSGLAPDQVAGIFLGIIAGFLLIILIIMYVRNRNSLGTLGSADSHPIAPGNIAPEEAATN